MANFKDSMKLLTFLEHSNDMSKLLHKNKGEDGLTFYGIYESAYPNWEGWRIIKRYLLIEPDLKKCSVILSNNIELDLMVQKFYKKEFWDKSKLDLVDSQKIANMIFCFAVNVGVKTANKKLQEALGFDKENIDGIVGNFTINHLNDVDESLFVESFKQEQKKYYIKLIANNPDFKKFENGWFNRIETVANFML